MLRTLPDPSDIPVEEWARRMYEYMVTDSPVRSEVEPRPVLLSHRTTRMERATQAGIYLYDPVYETPVSSINGKWEPTRSGAIFSIDYETDFNVDGATLIIGSNKVPFNTLAVNTIPWSTFDPVSSTFTLLQGEYAMEGYLSISKISGGIKRFVAYIALSSDLDTPVGTVQSASLYLPSSSPNLATINSPFRGVVNVPEGGGEYALVVRSSSATARFGTAHDFTGIQNIYASMTVRLAGLNEENA